MKNLSPLTEVKLGFDQIRNLLEGRAATEQGKALCMHLKPFPHSGMLLPELDRVEECRDLLLYDESFSLDYTGNVRDLLAYADIPGNWIAARDFFQLLRWLHMVRDLINYFTSRKAKYSNLYALASQMVWNKQLLTSIEAVIDERGNIKDNASPKLQSLRKEQQVASADLRKSLHAVLRHAIEKGWSDSQELTIRNDRLVIPMKADFKGRIKGFVHDVSQSGQTIFLEPSSALEANNRIRELILEEQNEVIRLLMVLTAHLRDNMAALHQYAEVVATLDFVRAKARLAVDLDAVKPRFDYDSKTLMLVKGRHPLLLLKHGGSKEKVVPLSLQLDSKRRIVLVSGPNAGGKSVTLKTIGLLQLMLQSGLLVPVDESSEFTWFTGIFVDIGDEQSLASDLSTYTSHLRNMKEMLAKLRTGKLFLLDEFGAGTDPRLGGAIAEAFLDRFLASGAYGVVTTHYGNLKNFADQRDGIQNAAMQFNPATLSPTFRIEVGVPGRSYAFEIAQNVGINKELLDDARTRIEGKQLETEDLLLRLESQRNELERVIADNRSKNEELGALLRRNQELTQRTKDSEAKILKEAHAQAQLLIDQANAKIEHTIKEIRESQADRERTKQLRRELAEMLPKPPAEEAAEIEAEEALTPTEEIPELVSGEGISIGDWALLKESNSYGQVLDIQDKRAVIALGEMRITVKLKHLQKIKPPKGHSAPVAFRQPGVMVQRKANISTEISVMGLRVEHALPQVQRFIDDAALAGLSEIRILHGKGTGALRISIRELLATIPEVQRFEDAQEDQGGAGWTVVYLLN